MKAIVSSTYDDQYLFFLPIINWCWNKLGVDVICFMPSLASNSYYSIYEQWLGGSTLVHKTAKSCQFEYFKCKDNKQATYSQCSRLYAAALDLPDNEILITSDVDMAVFVGFEIFPAATIPAIPDLQTDHILKIVGSDLTPKGQYPMCYAIGPAWIWRKFMQIDGRTYQQCLDDQLSEIECENMRGNLWSRDQELLSMYTQKERKIEFLRANPGTQFASCRVDRTDINWRSYLGESLVDAHLWRPGYTDENFSKILELLTTQYPEENFQWLIDYRNDYISLL
jgi:hypothetical protein